MAGALADAVGATLRTGTEALEGRALIDVRLCDEQVATVMADEGPTAKRIRPRAQGRAYRIRKRTSHITVIVESRPQRSKSAGASASAARSRRAQGSKAAAKKATPKTEASSEAKGGSQ